MQFINNLGDIKFVSSDSEMTSTMTLGAVAKPLKSGDENFAEISSKTCWQRNGVTFENIIRGWQQRHNINDRIRCVKK